MTIRLLLVLAILPASTIARGDDVGFFVRRVRPILMGLDHTRLTYRHGGRDYRLTDVHGEVVKGVLA